jgi:hypothetical protein
MTTPAFWIEPGPKAPTEVMSPSQTETGTELTRALALPPLSFQPAGNVRWACEATNPHLGCPPRRSPAQHNGLRFEKKVHQRLRSLYDRVECGPWFKFGSAEGPGARARFCSPDAILTLQSVPILLEVKYRYIPEAYWKLSHLYRPVVSVARRVRERDWALVAVVRTFDPFSSQIPRDSLAFHEIDALDALKPGSFSVVIFNPREL